jgi:hypothetical protein
VIEVRRKDRIWETAYAVAFVTSFERCRRTTRGTMRSIADVERMDHCTYAVTVADCAVEQLREEEDSKLEEAR